MNKRIKEFRFLAADYANEQKPLGTTKWHEIRDEKFAELIVRECIQAVDNVGGYNEEFHMNAIKEHFGVEE